jgi:hypothetical protein
MRSTPLSQTAGGEPREQATAHVTHPEDQMDSQFNYLIARQRQAELVSRAEQARLANDARAAVSAPSRRSSLGWLVATRRLRPAGLVAAAQPAGPPQECVRCDA